MDHSTYARPTQVHSVPLAERAVGSDGKTMPWAYVYPDNHPQARSQKRHAEERGPFGRSNRRQGPSRTRTATPAKKDHLGLDGFDQAMENDRKEAERQQAASAVLRLQTESKITSHHAPSLNKEPFQVMIFGYSESKQWSAIDLYESVSGGVICEDYERQPPAELKKYPNAFSSSPRARRPLTQHERAMASKFAGGEHWIKVTFDSAEAAERAMELSPVQMYGHWIYAQPYHGIGPDLDEPIRLSEDELQDGRFATKPQHKPFQTMGPSFAHGAKMQQRAAATVSRAWGVNAASQGANQWPNDVASQSSSTASSSTATGLDHPNLRHRNPTPAEENGPPDTQTTTKQQQSRRMMQHFPDVPQYELRPAHEAFLPHRTWWERQVKWLADQGLVPGEIIGDTMPILDNGGFDWARASYYWKFFYWIDTHLGTDICGFKDNDED